MSTTAVSNAGTMRGAALPDIASELRTLLTAAAVRERCERVFEWVEQESSEDFALDLSLLPLVARYVAEVTRDAYSDLVIPYHSRWRHFVVAGEDRWADLMGGARVLPIEEARAAIDLVTVSVLLDAGAGNDWRYRDARKVSLTRSEGLAIASLEAFAAGRFSNNPHQPYRTHGSALERLSAEELAEALQVSDANPLIGVTRRTELLQRLGRALRAQPEIFGVSARPGNMVDYILHAHRGRIGADALLRIILDAFAPTWPSALNVDGFSIGDAARHPAAATSDVTNEIVPFHKLSQWLTYSLIEPLMAAGIIVDHVEELTALAEYRNGGLLIDLGVVAPRDTRKLSMTHNVSSQFVAEWRALTIVLMDRLLPLVRDELQLGSGFKLPHMLQAGTWAAGRKIAKALRPQSGGPPISIAADGTVF